MNSLNYLLGRTVDPDLGPVELKGGRGVPNGPVISAMAGVYSIHEQFTISRFDFHYHALVLCRVPGDAAGGQDHKKGAEFFAGSP